MFRPRRPSPQPVSRAHCAMSWRIFASAAAVACVVTVAGCGAAPRTGPVIQLSSAQVTEPNANGTTEAYVDVQNNGPADKIVAATLSAGGHVMLRSPAHPGVVMMRTVPSIIVPAKSSVGLDPNGSHLLVIEAGHMKAGTEITLTLVFAHAGSISVPALVTNPQTGGSSYFLN
jgi:periplasmic copper chaperone A